MIPTEIEEGATYWVNTNHSNLPTWAHRHPQVRVMAKPGRDGYATVWPVDAPADELRPLHAGHLRTTPVPAGQPRSGTLTGAVHHISSEHGEQQPLFDLGGPS